MKKGLLLFAAAFSLLLVASPIHAQTASPSGSLTRQERIKQAQEEFKEARTEARENFKQDMAEVREDLLSDIAERHASRLRHRFNIYYTRMSQLIAKLQAKINDLSADGKDVTAAQAKLDEAKTSLDAAKASADQAVEDFLAIEPDSQRASALKARDIANQARQQFKTTLALMKEVVRLLKAIK